MKSFWTNRNLFGAYHESDLNSSRRHVSDLLLVFVHGIFGDPVKSWGTIPEWILKKSKIDIDVLSFYYPSMPWHRTSIDQAAKSLKSAIINSFEKGHKHILFVSHSTGGLIIKKMIADEYEDSKKMLLRKEKAFNEINLLFPRIRRIINIAVPHNGGNIFYSYLGITLYSFGLPFFSPIAFLLSRLSTGKLDWGLNKIIYQLRYSNKFLKQIESNYRSLIANLIDDELLYPISFDLKGTSDIVINNVDPLTHGKWQLVERGVNENTLRGTHSSIKHPKDDSDPIIQIIAKNLNYYRIQADNNIAYYTVSRTFDFNRTFSIKRLIGLDGSEPSLVTSNLKESISGSQNKIFKALVKFSKQSREQPAKVILTGNAGVGKSTVLRLFAKKLSIDFLRSGYDKPLAIFIPLNQLKLDLEERDQDELKNALWDSIVRKWCSWATKITQCSSITREWLSEILQNRRAIIILDGVDEYLLNNPQIDILDFMKALNFTKNKYRDNSHIAFILGTRITVPGIEIMSSGTDMILEILGLSKKDAIELLDDEKSWLLEVENSSLQRILMTPLIINQLKSISASDFKKLVTEIDIFNQVINSIIDKSSIESNDGEILSRNNYLDALTIIAWIFYKGFHGDMGVTQLVKEVKENQNLWKNHLQNKSFQNGYNIALDSYSIFSNEKFFNNLIKRTIFFPTGTHKDERIRFMHREFQEFLIGRYYAKSIMSHRISEISHVAFYPRHNLIAGQIIGNDTISEELLKKIVVPDVLSNPIISGNFCAFVTNAICTITAPGLRLLLSNIDKMNQLARCMVINGFSYRALAELKNDRSSKTLRDQLVPILFSYLNLDEEKTKDKQIVASAAYFYLLAFHRKFGTTSPGPAWPGLKEGADYEMFALSMMCDFENGVPVLSQYHRSTQTAFSTTPKALLHIHERPISVMHYVYYLVVVYRNSCHVAEVEVILQQIFQKDSFFEKKLMEYSLVPELIEMYYCCKTLFEKPARL